MTDLDHESYKGVDITMNKRYADKWQMNVALTLQTSKWFYAEGSNNWNNPTGREYVDGINNVSSYVFKVNGSYDLPYGITASTNFNWNQGGRRIVRIDGPEDVPGGLGSNGTGGPTVISLPAPSGTSRTTPCGMTRSSCWTSASRRRSRSVVGRTASSSCSMRSTS